MTTQHLTAITTTLDGDGHLRAAYGDRQDTIELLMAGVGLFEARHRTSFDNLDWGVADLCRKLYEPLLVSDLGLGDVEVAIPGHVFARFAEHVAAVAQQARTEESILSTPYEKLSVLLAAWGKARGLMA